MSDRPAWVPRSTVHSRVVPPNLATQVSYRFGPPLIYVSGELDHDSAPVLKHGIDQEIAGGATVVLLDFSDVLYMDSGGLSLMFETLHRLEVEGWMGIIGPNPGVRRMMEITGLADHPAFRLIDDLSQVPATLLGQR